MAREDAFALRLRQHRDEVIGRRLCPLVHLRRDVLDHPVDALHQVPHPVGLAAVDVEELVRQVAEVVAVLLGHAHHLRDHAHGQRSGERLEDVHPALRLDLVQELGDGPANERPPGLHRLRREVLVHRGAHGLVRRAILLHELVGAERPHLLEQRPVRGVDRRVRRPPVGADHGRGEELVVAQQPDEVLVAREDPHLGARVPVDGIGLPQSAEVGVGIGDDLGSEEILRVGRRPPRGSPRANATPSKPALFPALRC